MSEDAATGAERVLYCLAAGLLIISGLLLGGLAANGYEDLFREIVPYGRNIAFISLVVFMIVIFPTVSYPVIGGFVMVVLAVVGPRAFTSSGNRKKGSVLKVVGVDLVLVAIVLILRHIVFPGLAGTGNKLMEALSCLFSGMGQWITISLVPLLLAFFILAHFRLRGLTVGG